MRKYVIGAGDAGLCNRLGNLLSTERIARKLYVDFAYVWPVSSMIGCRYSDLFCGPLNEDIHQLWDAAYRVKTYNEVEGVRFVVDKHFNDADILFIKSWTAVGFPGESQEDIYREVDWSLIEPVPDIAGAINGFAAKISIGDRIGVHIRMSDNPQRYHITIEQLHALLIGLKYEKVFLATDNLGVEVEALKFSNVVCYPKRARCRNTLEGIKEAVIDLRLLSLTRRIIGTKWSSYTYFAGRWGATPVEMFNPDA